jgi:hypothetical protein
MHNLSAAKSTGFCLCALIDQRSVEGMLELDRDGVVEHQIILELRSRTPSRLPDWPRFRHFWGLGCGIRDYCILSCLRTNPQKPAGGTMNREVATETLLDEKMQGLASVVH